MSNRSGPRLERRGAVVWLTLDRPPLNLLEPALLAALRDEVLALRQDDSVRALVVTGAGRVMTAGMQLEVLRDLTPATARELIELLHQAIQAVHEAPFVTLALVNGACLGGGFELALACDLRVVASGARLGLPEVRVGIPSVIEAALLPALVGPGRAAELLLSGEPISAEQALAWGLANRVAPLEQLEATAAELLDLILRAGPRAIRLQKELMIAWRNTDQRTAIAEGVNAFAQAYTTDEPRESMQAFLEKRPPRLGG